MPIKSKLISKEARKYYENTSFEHLVSTWLQRDGWEVYAPYVDHGAKTDVLISDGNHFYRIQVKSVDTSDENIVVLPQWSEEDDIDFVIYFSKRADWGYITPKYSTRRKLKHPEHIRFHQQAKNFKKAFDKAQIINNRT